MSETHPDKPYITYYPELEQGSEGWLNARCGMLTTSEMKLILTPTLRRANNEKERSHLYELLAQRITRYVEPRYISDDMLRGLEDEIDARLLYAEHYAPVQEMGFIVNNRWGFNIGYSPDGLVNEDGAVEIKSRLQKYQIETITSLSVPDEYMIQLQTGLLVSERDWIDFISYSGGLPMITLRVFSDPKFQNAIVEAAGDFEEKLSKKMESYRLIETGGGRLIPTQRKIIQEMFVS